MKRAADAEVVWSLAERDQFVVEQDEQGSWAIPPWPHKRFAEARRVGAWAAREPMGVHLEGFVE